MSTPIAPPLVVHHLETSRSHRVLWLLEELGTPYELVVHRRNPLTRLAPDSLRQVHPLGKAPVIVHGPEVVAESGAILEYLAETLGTHVDGELAGLVPRPGTPAHRQCRFWMHYAEGSLMNWLLMKLVFATLPKQRMPFFARPIAKAMCRAVQHRLIDPNLRTAMAYIDQHLAQHTWFAGEQLSLADFQMCFAVEAAASRQDDPMSQYPHVEAYLKRLRDRPAYQAALAKGGPVIMPS